MTPCIFIYFLCSAQTYSKMKCTKSKLIDLRRAEKKNSEKNMSKMLSEMDSDCAESSQRKFSCFTWNQQKQTKPLVSAWSDTSPKMTWHFKTSSWQFYWCRESPIGDGTPGGTGLWVEKVILKVNFWSSYPQYFGFSSFL